MNELTDRVDEGNLLVVATDIHLGAPKVHDELDGNYRVLLNLFNKHKDVFLSGDIVDRTNCRESEVGTWTAIMWRLRNLYGGRYVLGNHCAHNRFNYYEIVEINGKRVAVVHGTGIYFNYEWYPIHYSEKRNKKWTHRSEKSLGRGRISYWWYGTWRKVSKHKGGWKEPSDKVKENLFRICELLEVEIITWGHTHRSYEGVYHGKRFINLPKGINYIRI